MYKNEIKHVKHCRKLPKFFRCIGYKSTLIEYESSAVI